MSAGEGQDIMASTPGLYPTGQGFIKLSDAQLRSMFPSAKTILAEMGVLVGIRQFSNTDGAGELPGQGCHRNLTGIPEKLCL